MKLNFKSEKNYQWKGVLKSTIFKLFCKVNSVQEACAKCFAVHILEFEILQTSSNWIPCTVAKCWRKVWIIALLSVAIAAFRNASNWSQRRSSGVRIMCFSFPLNSQKRNWHTKKLSNFAKLQFLNNKFTVTVKSQLEAHSRFYRLLMKEKLLN